MATLLPVDVWTTIVRWLVEIDDVGVYCAARTCRALRRAATDATRQECRRRQEARAAMVARDVLDRCAASFREHGDEWSVTFGSVAAVRWLPRRHIGAECDWFGDGCAVVAFGADVDADCEYATLAPLMTRLTWECVRNGWTRRDITDTYWHQSAVVSAVDDCGDLHASYASCHAENARTRCWTIRERFPLSDAITEDADRRWRSSFRRAALHTACRIVVDRLKELSTPRIMQATHADVCAQLERRNSAVQ